MGSFVMVETRDDVKEAKIVALEARVKQLEDSMEELASILRDEIAEIRRKVGNR